MRVEDLIPNITELDNPEADAHTKLYLSLHNVEQEELPR